MYRRRGRAQLLRYAERYRVVRQPVERDAQRYLEHAGPDTDTHLDPNGRQPDHTGHHGHAGHHSYPNPHADRATDGYADHEAEAAPAGGVREAGGGEAQGVRLPSGRRRR
jgi:hypothetical protein